MRPVEINRGMWVTIYPKKLVIHFPLWEERLVYIEQAENKKGVFPIFQSGKQLDFRTRKLMEGLKKSLDKLVVGDITVKPLVPRP